VPSKTFVLGAGFSAGVARRVVSRCIFRFLAVYFVFRMPTGHRCS
jgi:hypothetical protein